MEWLPKSPYVLEQNKKLERQNYNLIEPLQFIISAGNLSNRF